MWVQITAVHFPWMLVNGAAAGESVRVCITPRKKKKKFKRCFVRAGWKKKRKEKRERPHICLDKCVI